MGRDVNELGGRSTRKPKQGKASVASRIFNYHPTLEHKRLMEEANLSLDDALAAIADRLTRGCSITISTREDGAVFAAILRDATVAWEQAPAVAVWHKDLGRALVGLAFYFLKVAPEWPDVLPLWQQGEFNW